MVSYLMIIWTAVSGLGARVIDQVDLKVVIWTFAQSIRSHERGCFKQKISIHVLFFGCQCRLLITIANSFDPDLSGLIWIQAVFSLIVFLIEHLEKVKSKKKKNSR